MHDVMTESHSGLSSQCVVGQPCWAAEHNTAACSLLPPSGMGHGTRRAKRKFMGWDKNCIINKRKPHNTINNRKQSPSDAKPITQYQQTDIQPAPEQFLDKLPPQFYCWPSIPWYRNHLGQPGSAVPACHQPRQCCDTSTALVTSLKHSLEPIPARPSTQRKHFLNLL